jgi:hypothetical protein
MKKTSLTLVAALAATTALGPARAESYLSAREALSHIYGGKGINGEAIANMSDQQCRDYVAQNVRAMATDQLRDSLKKNERAEDAIQIFKALKADLDRGQRLFFGIGPRADSKAVHDLYLALLTVWETKKFALTRVIDLITLKAVIDVIKDVSEGTGDAIDLAKRITQRSKELEKWRSDVRKITADLDAHIAKHEAEKKEALDGLDKIEDSVRKAQRKHCDSGARMSLPSEADITGSAISDYGARVGGPMFTAVPKKNKEHYGPKQNAGGSGRPYTFEDCMAQNPFYKQREYCETYYGRSRGAGSQSAPPSKGGGYGPPRRSSTGGHGRRACEWVC